MSLIDRVLSCADYNAEDYHPLLVDGHKVGQVSARAAGELANFGTIFDFINMEIHLSQDIKGFKERSTIMSEVARNLFDRGLIVGWREELYPVAPKFGVPALFNIERAAVPFFGIRGYGVHINGWLGSGNEPQMWIGRRSRSKPTGAGQLDQVVAGGLPFGIGLMENVIKECQEEASIGALLARQAIPVGTVSYITKREEGLRHDVLFNYDLRLPENFTPINGDGEVDEFMLWPISKVVHEVGREGVFKFNSALVVIDYLVRHGFISPESPGYTEIVSGLHREG